MVLLLLLALALIALSITLALRVAGSTHSRRREALEHIGAYGFSTAASSAPASGPVKSERLASLATALGGIYGRYARSDHEREIRELLRSAGLYRMRVSTFMGYRVLSSVGTALLLLWLLGVAGGGAATLLVAVAFGALGWVGPLFLLRRRAANRLNQIDREVPELVDLLVTTVEAGVGFASALQITARRVEGPLGEELRVALSEQGLGLTINDALKNMLVRANSPALRMFVQAILQGDTLGVSIGKILRDLAVDMRKRRRQAAEERAQKAPTKIIFPLVLLILPALFIIAVWPIVYSFLHGLGG